MELNQKTLKKAYNYLSKDPCLDHLINKFSSSIDIFERFNEISVSDGKTFEYLGINNTSSKVKDSFIAPI